MTEYFDANVAREVQKKTLEMACTEELDGVFASINKVINSPKIPYTFAYYCKHLSDGTVAHLEKLGYKVSQYSDERNETTVTISW